ncbi:hypothetical protein HPB49_015042 [Dermacentor silvarum]|uniref:Uncharacterized protein n=1 Tax=Dermacentor silvarum TaxID=543639 RepID=A0ACB8E152_DERSI|nr:hypothetical protein HPB49_015042 [Dermacentor silvarum]
MGLMKWSDLTLTVNTDGSPLYKSSNASIWPIQLSINELPQPHRNANTFLAGLWLGGNTLIWLFYWEVCESLTDGWGDCVWQHGAVDLISRVYLACVCVDAPARAAVGNQTQFNGCFGCPWCLACGTLQEGRRLYINSEPPAPERTAAGIRRDMKLAMELQTPVNGLKGPSAFWPLQYLDLVECYTVEYMHCVLLGVTRQFTEYGRPSTLNFLNRRLKGIQPPHHITRLPRSIQERHFWKAHEWRNWLLYYCLPCCQNTLPSPYMKHFAILSEAIFLLLQEQLSPPAIAQADNLLRRFVNRAAALYSDRCMTFNVHQILHLARAARNFGPLWAHSAFGFESGNGQLVKLVTAANGVPEQILERVILSQELKLLLCSTAIPLTTKQLCHDFLHYPNVEKAQHIQEPLDLVTTEGSETPSTTDAKCHRKDCTPNGWVEGGSTNVAQPPPLRVNPYDLLSQMARSVTTMHYVRTSLRTASKQRLKQVTPPALFSSKSSLSRAQEVFCK